VHDLFPCQLAQFPCKYLGVPLSIYQLKKGDLQPMLDSVAARLPPWRGHLMSKAGRVTLTKTTLSAIPMHTSIVVKIAPDILHDIDRIRHSFVWIGFDNAIGGQCTVASAKVTRPVDLSRLGVIDVATFGYALRLQWEWFARADPERLASSLPSKPGHILKTMSDASMTVKVGNSANVLFWADRWLPGFGISSFAPNVINGIRMQVRKSRLVADAMQRDA
jgi:hypothetical protein